MNNAIGLYNLVDESTNFVLIHRPNFIEAILITLFKSLEFVLKLLELLGELLVVISKLDVLSLVLLALSLKLFLDSSEYVLVSSFLGLETSDGIVVDLFSLLENLQVELKFLLIESVDTLHIFHALFKDLHFLLELDLLLSLIIGILGSKLFELLRVRLFIFRTLVLEMLFQFLVLLKEVLDLVLISL